MGNKTETGKRAYLRYTLWFLITGAFVFGWFAVSGKSMVWKFDGVYQHFNTLVYYGKYLRKILHSLFVEHKFCVPMWDMSIGYGADILTTLNYYAIGDPLTLLSVLVPGSLTEYLYAALIILRFYLAGAAFTAYCRYHQNEETGVLLGSLVYAFSGFALFCGVRHPYFVNPMIYLPLILIGIDKIFRKEKPWLYVIMVAVSAVSNFYFFYMIVLMMVIYAVIRYLMIYKKIRIRELVPCLGTFAGWSLLGVGISLPVLLPSAMYVLGTGRMSARNYVPVLYPLAHYAKLLNDFFGVDYTMASSRYYTVMGFAPILLVALLVLLVRWKKNRELKAGWLILTVLLLIPFAGHMINGFSYVSNRWIWAYGMLLSYILVKMYPEFGKLEKKERMALLVLGCVVLPAGELILNQYATLHGWIGIGMTMLLTAKIADPKHSWQQRQTTAFFLVTTLVSVAANAYFLFSPNQTNYIGDFREQGAPYAMVTTQAQNEIIQEIGDTDTFYRYDQYGNVARENTAMQNRLYGTDFYYSVTNNAVAEFLQEMDTSNSMEQMYDGLDGRTILDRLTGVRYFIIKKEKEQYLPYGYTEKVAENKKYAVYRTDETLPFGYTYSSVISQDSWDSLKVVEKQQAMLQGAWIKRTGNTEADLPETELSFSDVTPEYEITTEGDITISGSEYQVKEKDASITFHYQGVENCETYLVIEGLDYEGTATKFTLKIDRDNVEKKGAVYTCRNSFYSGKEDFLYNLGYHSEASSEVTLTFQQKGTYTIEKMYLSEQPMNMLDEQTEARKEDQLENLVIGDNIITGDITLDQRKLLVLSLAYSTGWKAYVDGQEQTLLQTNGMFCGLKLESGKHRIKLRYQTPYLIPGLITGLFSILLCMGIALQMRKKK